MPETIQSLVQDFALQLEALIKRSALEQVMAALGSGSTPARRGRKPGRIPGRPDGRSISKIDADQLLAYVKANPGSRGEQVAAGMRSDVKAIRGSMHKLIAAKKVRTTGQRRGMRYFAGAAGPRVGVKGGTAKKGARGRRRGKVG